MLHLSIGCLLAYQCIQFPYEWVLHTTAFEGEKVADSFFYTDDDHQKWLFMNKSSRNGVSLDNELYIYKVDSYRLNKIEAHHQNPIYIDTRIARNGGAIFTYKSEKFRPSQNNSEGFYGRSLNISRVNKLTLEVYEEEKVDFGNPDIKHIFQAMHHLHQIDGQFVFDGIKN